MKPGKKPTILRPISRSELGPACVCLAKRPIWWDNVCECLCYAVGCGDHEGQSLAVEIRIWLPISPPVPRHSCPPCFWALDLDWFNWSGVADVCDRDQFEVIPTVDRESNSTTLLARNPASHVIFISNQNYRNNFYENIFTIPSNIWIFTIDSIYFIIVAKSDVFIMARFFIGVAVNGLLWVG